MKTIVETSINAEPAAVTERSLLVQPMLVAALFEHLRHWLGQLLRFSIGALAACGILALAQWPGLAFLAGFSALGGVLYVANMADVERYRDSVLYLVPTLFIWSLLVMGASHPLLVGLSLFTHVFLAFVGAFATVTGTLRQLRLWSMLLGFYLALLIYWVSAFLL